MKEQLYEIWYKKYVDEMYSYGMSFSLKKDDVLDIIHDVFLHLYEINYDCSDNTNIKFYLLCCMKNKIISFCRKETKYISVDINNELDFSLQPLYTNVFEEENEQEAFKKSIDKALTHLTNKQKEIIYLRFNQELSYEEISVLLNTTPKNVRKLTYRALEKLKGNIQNPRLSMFTIITLINSQSLLETYT